MGAWGRRGPSQRCCPGDLGLAGGPAGVLGTTGAPAPRWTDSRAAALTSAADLAGEGGGWLAAAGMPTSAAAGAPPPALAAA
eukprot:1832961-Pyramimonas_sp.AAC.2